jgi:hypothetical protein
MTSSPLDVYEFRRAIWLWRSLAILFHAAWFALMSGFGWMIFVEVSRGNGFWTVIGTVYVMAVVLIWYPLLMWLRLRRGFGFWFHKDWVRTTSVCVGLTAFLVIMLFGLSAADTGLWIFGTLLFLFVGTISHVLLALFLWLVFLRRIP